MDFTASSSDELKALYPSMKTNTRIAVVGGGPSGLSAAYQLVKLGYKNVTVLEQHSKVGGMCGSELIEGTLQFSLQDSLVHFIFLGKSCSLVSDTSFLLTAWQYYMRHL